ncbi:hypothetical protein CJ483_01930 [Bacillus sp. PK3_68]|nr:hypothetical protein CJ483_01930 [Bacillus sp. PK3_68]
MALKLMKNQKGFRIRPFRTPFVDKMKLIHIQNEFFVLLKNNLAKEIPVNFHRDFYVFLFLE